MRVLVVEDERRLATLVATAIREAGLGADVAHDGHDGLRLALEHAYDAVILDLLLPGLPGLSVLRELRRTKPALPVLVLTALDETAEKVEGLDRGADDYVTKPFVLDELMARLRALLRRGSEHVRGASVEVGDLTVDLARRAVSRGGREIRLTSREFALLAFFCNRQGAVLARDEIGAHVIDRNFEVSSNVIDVLVCALRAKLGAPSLIRTVRGAGYRFGPPGAP